MPVPGLRETGMRTSGDGGVHGQSSAYGADGMRSREEGALQGPGSWDGASTQVRCIPTRERA